ncbi:hypothetical protein [Desulfonema magnum]|uniref:Uncharacterized protein n=1 Tax=Desulfonema magnum TaxID=45655 RepID=A0A975BXH9_9BACT|nr:hypothetical protein [Desulfonema magnum]QTA93108.1 Uncharacterized protein dnm_092050 [Desulfonema magnum]
MTIDNQQPEKIFNHLVPTLCVGMQCGRFASRIRLTCQQDTSEISIC